VLPIKFPPWREQSEDIPPPTTHLQKKHCSKLNRPLKEIAGDLLHMFMAAPWKGNIRELENVLVQGIMFSKSNEIRPEDIGFNGKQKASAQSPNPEFFRNLAYKEAKESTLEAFNTTYIGNLLKKTGGNVTQAARECDLERQSLQQIMRRYNISADNFREPPQE